MAMSFVKNKVNDVIVRRIQSANGFSFINYIRIGHMQSKVAFLRLLF
jgi:hypothetical protein